MNTAKIIRVETQILADPYLPQLLVRVSADDNLSGLGECWWGVSPVETQAKGVTLPPGAAVEPIAAAVDHILGPLLVGQDPGNIEGLWHQLIRYAYRYGDEGVIRCALSGIDLALWDLLGKRLNAPLVQLFGGAVRRELRAYASLPPLRDAGRIRQEIRRAQAAGFKGIKLHEYDPETAALARREVGDQMALMFDVNGRFSPLEAVDAARRLAPHNLTWFEEPVWPMRDHAAMARIRRETGIRLAAGENEFGLQGFHGLMTQAGVDYIMPEITKIGGLTAARKIAALAELFNATLSPHGYRIGPALYANVHWAMSCLHCDWLEVPFLPEGFEFPAKINLPPMEDGLIRLPPGAGLGLPPGIGSKSKAQSSSS